jgi:hypothetical protein
VYESAELTIAEEDELTEIRNNRRLKMKYSSINIPSYSHFGNLSDRSTPSSERRLLKYSFFSLHIYVRLASLL